MMHFSPVQKCKVPEGVTALNLCPSMKYLGVTFTDQLSWDEDLKECLGKCRFLLQTMNGLIV